MLIPLLPIRILRCKFFYNLFKLTTAFNICFLQPPLGRVIYECSMLNKGNHINTSGVYDLPKVMKLEND